MRFWLPALIAIAVIPVAAHHPFTPYYDGSRPASISGSIVELRMVNPHAVLIISGTAPDGHAGRWAFEGSAPNALVRRQADYKERLKIGATVTISGWPATDPQARAFSANTVTFADGTTMVFGSTTPSNGWRCTSPDPCLQYTYPAVQ